MANERITASMDMKKMLITMSEGNPGALTCMMEMLRTDPMALLDILYFDSMGIYGSKIYMLWNDCCGAVSKKEIHENLNRVRAVPFI